MMKDYLLIEKLALSLLTERTKCECASWCVFIKYCLHFCFGLCMHFMFIIHICWKRFFVLFQNCKYLNKIFNDFSVFYFISVIYLNTYHDFAFIIFYIGFLLCKSM